MRKLLTVNRELRLELGLPGSGINESQYPHIFPSPPSFNDVQEIKTPLEEILPSKFSPVESDRAHLETSWFFYLGEIALRKLMNRILLSRYESGRSESGAKSEMDMRLDLITSIAEFDLQLQQW